MRLESKGAEGAEPKVITRSEKSNHKPSMNLAVTNTSQNDWKDEPSDEAMKADIEIKAAIKMLKSHMLVVKKHLALGEFDKMKARVMEDYMDQDVNQQYPNNP